MGSQRIDGHSLNRRIAVLREGPASDDGAGKVAGPMLLLCWRRASVKPARRREISEGQGTEAKVELTAWLRHDSVTRTITERDRVWHDGRLFEITAAPIEIGMRGGIELLLVASDAAVVIDPDALDPVV